MRLLPILSVLAPLVGAAAALALSLVPSARRYARLVGVASAALAAFLFLASRQAGSLALVLSRWQPSLLFGAMPVLQLEPAVQTLALLMAVVTACALLLGAAGGEEKPVGLFPLVLVLLSIGAVVLWSANVLTLIASWAAYDLVYAFVRYRAGSRGAAIVRGLVLGSAATLLLWGGALLSDNAGALTRLWDLAGANGAQMALWALAGIIRLGLYPLHLSIPDDLPPTPDATALMVQQRLLGLGLWVHIASVNGGALPDIAWLPAVAAAAVMMGGILSWTRESSHRSLPWLGNP